MQYGLGAHGALIPHFPESLTRKLYRKKIPEMALNVPQVPREVITDNTGNTSAEAGTGVKR
ncbi:MAG: hypothetical protein CVV30_04755 [Methanomicrobiales archaeon HGW-Methanomicrobiales-1]|jgi:hypothetical protein|nr:MAG: hypothetical protein CVV30_04755 [Methanomicrobiales archaeon HGW-Methanomicrobiales-1]